MTTGRTCKNCGAPSHASTDYCGDHLLTPHTGSRLQPSPDALAPTELRVVLTPADLQRFGMAIMLHLGRPIDGSELMAIRAALGELIPRQHLPQPPRQRRIPHDLVPCWHCDGAYLTVESRDQHVHDCHPEGVPQ